MEFFKMLEIEPTIDKEAVKRAYRRLLPKYHPEDDPEGFQRLRNAFEEAMKYEEREKEDTTETDIWLKRVEEVYKDFEKRLDVACWEELLNDEISFSLDTASEANNKLLNFLSNHFYLPHEVWSVLENHFMWEEKKRDLYNEFPIEFVDYIIANAKYEDTFRYYEFDVKPGKDYDRFISNYFYLLRNIYDNTANEREAKLQESVAMEIEHPDFTILRIRYSIIGDNLELASELCRGLLEKYQDVSSWYSASKLELELNNNEKSREYSYKILAESPKHVGARIALADSFFNDAFYDEALENYEIAKELIPYDSYVNNAIFNSNRAIFEKYRESVDESSDTSLKMEYLEFAVNSRNYEEAIKMSSGIDLSVADSFEYHNLLGRAYGGINEAEEAVKHFDEALKQETEASKESVYADIGLQYVNVEEYEKALEKYNEGLELYKDSVMLTYRKASVKIKMGEYVEAVGLCDKILETQEVPNAYHFKAEALYFLEEYGEALKNCDLAMRIEKYYLTYLLKLNIFNIIRYYEQLVDLAEFLQSVELGTTEVLILKTKALIELKRYEEAKNEINKTLDMEADNGAAMYQLARILYIEGKYNESLAYLQKSEDCVEDKNAYNYFIANIYVNLNMNDEAERIYLDLLEVAKTDYAYYRLGYIYERTRRFDEAVSCYETALEMNPEHYYANGDLADVYQTLNDIDKALHYNKRQLEINPMDYFYVQRGNLYGKKGMLKKQLENFYKALELNPNNSFANNNAGAVHMKLAEYEKAAELFAKSIECNHPYREPFLNIGLCLLKLKRFDDAVGYLKAGVAKFPKDTIFCIRIGDLYSFCEEYEEAIKYYQMSIDAEEGKDLEDFIKIGRCYMRMKKYKKALEYYNVAHSIDKKNPDPYEEMGDLYYDDGVANYKKAISFYNKAFKVNNDSGYLPLNIGKCYKKLNKKDKAKTYFKIALNNYIAKANAGDAEACDYKNVAEVYFMLDEYEKAFEYYGKALERGPYYKFCNAIGCYDAYNDLGKMHEKLGDNKTALFNYEKANEIAGKGHYAKEVERIKKMLKGE